MKVDRCSSSFHSAVLAPLQMYHLNLGTYTRFLANSNVAFRREVITRSDVWLAQ